MIDEICDDPLKPCPFCGGEAVLWRTLAPDGTPLRYIRCWECGIRTDDYLGINVERALVECWNRRRADRVDVDSLAEGEYSRTPFGCGNSDWA